jgi:concentrative nucleoside transporter, CNT family
VAHFLPPRLSLGIVIAGLSTMSPERRDDVLSLGPKSILSGTICLMAAIVGVLT